MGASGLFGSLSVRAEHSFGSNACECRWCARSRSAPDRSRAAGMLAFVDFDGSLCGISAAGEASCASGSGTVAHVARRPTLPTACSDRATDVPESRHVATPSASMDDTLQACLEPHFVSPNAFREVAAYVQVSWVSATALKME